MPDVTPKLGLKKPLGNETVSRTAYNENLDILDANVAKAEDLETVATDIIELAGAGHTTETVKETADTLVTHLADIMPHLTGDGGYRWGLRINGDASATLIYEEVS